MKIPKRVTAAKAAANKLNAKKSTGPKFAQGKRFASQNSIRHGILTRDLLLPRSLSGESADDLEQLRKELIASYGAVGSSELAQVEIEVSSMWRLRRLYRAEAGEITKLLSEFNPAAEILACDHTRQFQQANVDLAELEKIEEQIDSDGFISKVNLDWIRSLPYGEPARLFVTAIESMNLGEGESDKGETDKGKRPSKKIPAPSEKLAQDGPTRATTTESQKPTTGKSATLSHEDGGFVRDLLAECLGSLKDAIRAEAAHHGQYSHLQVTAKSNALQVPQETVINRITRYENHLLRILYAAHHELERMQRLRRGEKVPAPTARVD